MTKKEIIARLEELGVEFDPKARKNGLLALLNEEAKKAQVEDESEEELVEEPEEEPEVVLPSFEGHKVLEILPDGHTATHYHCRLDNGTTAHVPRTKF